MLSASECARDQIIKLFQIGGSFLFTLHFATNPFRVIHGAQECGCDNGIARGANTPKALFAGKSCLSGRERLQAKNSITSSREFNLKAHVSMSPLKNYPLFHHTHLYFAS